MSIEEKKVRKFLNKKIQKLNDIIAELDGFVTELGSEYFRVSIFGSARIKPESDEYKMVYRLAYELSSRGIDIVTGGGPGLMEAANRGGKEGSEDSRSFGLAIKLPFEADANAHLDVKYHHQRFSSRLEEFMRMSHAVIVTPGGIGTILELFYTWQLLQVHHISDRPIILLGDMWKGLLTWMKDGPLSQKLLDQSDIDRIYMANSIEEAIAYLDPHVKAFAKGHKDLKD